MNGQDQGRERLLSRLFIIAAFEFFLCRYPSILPPTSVFFHASHPLFVLSPFFSNDLYALPNSVYNYP